MNITTKTIKFGANVKRISRARVVQPSDNSSGTPIILLDASQAAKEAVLISLHANTSSLEDPKNVVNENPALEFVISHIIAHGMTPD